MDNQSKNLKGLFTFDDLTDSGVRISQENCYTLQDYTYDCHRSRNKKGEPYGNTVGSVLWFTVKVSGCQKYKPFYDQLQSRMPHSFTFLFNATFDSGKYLESYDSALVISGFLIDAEEYYRSSTEEQMSLKLGVLLKSIVYMGNTDKNNKELVITR